MRTQTVELKTGKIKKILYCMGIISLCTAAIFVGYHFFFHKPDFVPPAYDTNAQRGLPTPDSSLGFGSVAAPTGFSVGLCGTMYQQEDGSLRIYLTNPETNEVNIRCEIKNEAGEIIYQSGVIRPDEYIEKLTPVKSLKNEAMPIQLFIYGYEQDSWYSKGTIVLDNVLQAY